VRRSRIAVSPILTLLAVMLFCRTSIPAYASGDDKAAAPAPTAARLDRGKKVFTNDDFDLMWPKPQAADDGSQTSPTTRLLTTLSLRRSVADTHATRAASEPTSSEKDPLWYAARFESLFAELDSVSSREESLREFRATGTGTALHFGLQLNAPCEGYTTDNEVEQLAIRKQEIEQQIDDLQTTAQQNGMSREVFQEAPEILHAAQKPLSPEQEKVALKERQSELNGQLDGVQDELSDMSNQAAALGAVLLPPTPGWGGNPTTNLIQTLDSRADEIRSALNENEDAARRAGLLPSALP
jgi:hypothetical protein